MLRARVKTTGKLLENVIPIMSVDSKVVMFHEYGTENDYYYYEDLDFSNTIDWEQTRIQVAIAAMDIVKDAYNIHDDIEQLVRHSVRIADTFVAELKKGGNDETE